MAKIFRILLGTILIIIGLSICYVSMPIFIQGEIITAGVGVALALFGLAIFLSGIAILRGASIKETLLMLHLSS